MAIDELRFHLLAQKTRAIAAELAGQKILEDKEADEFKRTRSMHKASVVVVRTNRIQMLRMGFVEVDYSYSTNVPLVRCTGNGLRHAFMVREIAEETKTPYLMLVQP